VLLARQVGRPIPNPEEWKAEFTYTDWLYTEIVYPHADGHSSN